jgi:hypothetical protein
LLSAKFCLVSGDNFPPAGKRIPHEFDHRPYVFKK